MIIVSSLSFFFEIQEMTGKYVKIQDLMFGVRDWICSVTEPTPSIKLSIKMS